MYITLIWVTQNDNQKQKFIPDLFLAHPLSIGINLDFKNWIYLHIECVLKRSKHRYSKKNYLRYRWLRLYTLSKLFSTLLYLICTINFWWNIILNAFFFIWARALKCFCLLWLSDIFLISECLFFICELEFVNAAHLSTCPLLWNLGHDTHQF